MAVRLPVLDRGRGAEGGVRASVLHQSTRLGKATTRAMRSSSRAKIDQAANGISLAPLSSRPSAFNCDPGRVAGRRPGRSPGSIAACLIQPRKVTAFTPVCCPLRTGRGHARRRAAALPEDGRTRALTKLLADDAAEIRPGPVVIGDTRFAGRELAVGSLGRDWLASQTHLKPSSLHVLEVAWRVHVEPVWGHRAVGEIRHSEVQDWVAELSSRKSATMVLRAYGVLAGVVERAVKDRRLESNPVRGVNLPRKRPKPRHYLTHRQVRLLAAEARSHETLVLLLSYTGLRWGEAVALPVSAVDLDRGRLLVSANDVNVA